MFSLWQIISFLQFLLFGFSSSVTTRPSEIVELKSPKNSKIQGKTYTFEDGREATAFLGIPYAQPPIGNLRFKKPLPATSWTGVKDATAFGNRCFYTTAVDYGVKPSEDCLFANVFVPGSSFKKREKLLPIAFYIHGGAFVSDNSQLLGDENICRYLNSKDVIVVTINYRLQFFGFLTIDEKTAGNFGLWDMRLALQWIRDNAEAFGGDVNSIIVFGQSAGSVATDLLTMSPHTRDLFDKAIMFAGTKNLFFSITPMASLRQNAIAFAENQGFKLKPGSTKEEENEQLLNFYQTSPAENITIGWYPQKVPRAYLTAPSIDFDFFPKSPDELRKEAPRKRTVTGVTEYEGLLFLTIKPRSTNIYDYVKYLLVNSYFTSPQINNTVAEIILQTFVNMSLDHDSLEFYKQCTVVLSDFIFNYPTYKMINTRVGLGETAYLYRFNYFKRGTLGSTNVIPFKAATHTLELPYIFGKSILPYPFIPNEQDKQKIEEFTTYLTNFMKNGKPGFDWLPYNPRTNSYFLFAQNSTDDGMQTDFCNNRMQKWEELYKRYNIHC